MKTHEKERRALLLQIVGMDVLATHHSKFTEVPERQELVEGSRFNFVSIKRMGGQSPAVNFMLYRLPKQIVENL